MKYKHLVLAFALIVCSGNVLFAQDSDTHSPEPLIYPIPEWNALILDGVPNGLINMTQVAGTAVLRDKPVQEHAPIQLPLDLAPGMLILKIEVGGVVYKSGLSPVN